MREAGNIASYLAEKHFNQSITLEPIIDMGTCNKVFIAATSQDKIVVRINHDRSSDEFAKEHWFMRKAEQIGLNGAHSIDYGIYEGWNYNLQTFIPGINGKKSDDPLAIWHWLGETAALLRQFPIERSAVTEADPVGNVYKKWPKYIDDNILALSEKRYSSDIGLTEEQSAQLRRRFETIYGKTYQFGICHGDMSLSNVIVNGDQKTLIDWGCACIQIVPHYEVMEIMCAHDENSPEMQAFIKGANLSVEWPLIRNDVQNLMLVRALDLVRWANDRKPDIKAEKIADLHKLMNKFSSDPAVPIKRLGQNPAP